MGRFCDCGSCKPKRKRPESQLPPGRARQIRFGLRAATKAEVYVRDGMCCRYCLTGAGGKLTIDHIHPIALGGKNEKSNLVLACDRCNFIKADRPFDHPVFIRYLRAQRLSHKYARRLRTKTLFFSLLYPSLHVGWMSLNQRPWTAWQWMKQFMTNDYGE